MYKVFSEGHYSTGAPICTEDFPAVPGPGEEILESLKKTLDKRAKIWYSSEAVAEGREPGRQGAGIRAGRFEKNLKKVLDKPDESKYNSNVPPGMACTL